MPEKKSGMTKIYPKMTKIHPKPTKGGKSKKSTSRVGEAVDDNKGGIYGSEKINHTKVPQEAGPHYRPAS